MAMQILLFLVNILMTPVFRHSSVRLILWITESLASYFFFFFAFAFASVMYCVPLAYYEVPSTSSTKS